MSDSATDDRFCVGVLDHEAYGTRLLPLVTQIRAGESKADALAELRTFLTGLKDKTRREDSLSQLERIEVAVQSSRWHRSAAGQILELACVEEFVRVPDELERFRAGMDFIYLWDETHAEVIHRFLAFLGDHTLPWASPGDTWRAIVTPDQLAEVYDAFDALSPRALKKMLVNAEDGGVFSPEEATAVSDWYGELRRIVRLAHRQDSGFFIAVRDA